MVLKYIWNNYENYRRWKLYWYLDIFIFFDLLKVMLFSFLLKWWDLIWFISIRRRRLLEEMRYTNSFSQLLLIIYSGETFCFRKILLQSFVFRNSHQDMVFTTPFSKEICSRYFQIQTCWCFRISNANDKIKQKGNDYFHY